MGLRSLWFNHKTPSVFLGADTCFYESEPLPRPPPPPWPRRLCSPRLLKASPAVFCSFGAEFLGVRVAFRTFFSGGLSHEVTEKFQPIHEVLLKSTLVCVQGNISELWWNLDCWHVQMWAHSDRTFWWCHFLDEKCWAVSFFTEITRSSEAGWWFIFHFPPYELGMHDIIGMWAVS